MIKIGWTKIEAMLGSGLGLSIARKLSRFTVESFLPGTKKKVDPLSPSGCPWQRKNVVRNYRNWIYEV